MIVDLGADYQERFRLYLTDLDKQDGDKVSLYEYLIWNSRKCGEFKEGLGKKWTDTIRADEQKEFTEFLRRKVNG